MSVNVRIPGVGVVSADNAATETTLRALLQAMTAAQGRQRRADSETAAASRQQAGFADRAADSMGQMAASAKSSESAARSLFSNLSENINRVSMAGGDIKDSGVATYLKQLGATAVEVSALWAKNFGELPTNPVKQATGLIATAIDAVGDGMGTGLKKILPKAFEKLPEAGTAVVKMGLKTSVGVLANELNTNIKAYSQLNKMGASFADSMTGMRDKAFASGLTVDQFAASMVKVEPQLRAMGMNMASAMSKVSGTAKEFDQVNAKTGKTFREEMRLLGYSTEEQVELSAQVLANMRSEMTAEKFRQTTDKQVAERTRQYAEDLKVLQDITGKNAKAAMEEARAKAMEADIIAQLSPEEAEKFKAAYANMPDYAKKGFLEYVSSGGTAIVDATTNILMSQNQQIERLIKGGYSSMKDASKSAQDVQKEVLYGAVDVNREQMRLVKQGGGAAIATAARMGAQGLEEIRSGINSVLSTGLYSKEDVDASIKNGKKLSEGRDKLTNSVVGFQGDAQTFAVEMSKVVGTFLPEYATALREVIRATNDFTFALTKLITGKTAPKGSPPGTEPTEKYTLDQYEADMARFYGNYVKPLIDGLDGILVRLSQAPRYQTGGVGDFGQGQLAMLHGKEAVIPLKNGKSIPVDFGTTGVPDLSNVVQQMQSTFTAVAAAKSAPAAPQEYKSAAKEQIQELPTALSSALETVLSGPAGLVQTMTQVKTQIADDNRMQMEMMQQQIESLTKLVDTMQENVRYSERLANELA
jgi:hypothetical protein